MTQLVELQKDLANFGERGVQVIGLLRNEKLGVEGLKLAKENTKASFPLAYDVKAKATARYAPKFTTYLIDEAGIIRAVLGPENKRPVKPSVIIEEIEKLRKTDSKKGAAVADEPVRSPSPMPSKPCPPPTVPIAFSGMGTPTTARSKL